MTDEQLTVRQQQEVMFEGMKHLHQFLCKNNLRYVMLYGTLLGAVRHHGFIPWDNDMDIGMPRPDYQKLLDLCSRGVEIGPHLYPLHYELDDKYHYQIMRICNDQTIVRPDYIREQPNRMGVWIDIFPFDGIAPKGFCSKLRHLRLLALKWMNIADIYSIRGKHDLANIAGNISCSLFPNTLKHNRSIEKMLMAYSYDESKLVTDTGWFDGYASWLTKMDFDQPELLEFESARFFAPHDYKGYLTRCYGHDYMDPPPPEKRFTHTVDARWA